MENGDLRQKLNRNKFLKEEESRFIIVCVLLGLEFIHRQGIIHRDIKPENIVIDKNGYLKITDFGISKEWARDNFEECYGTPGYMAPEILVKQNHGIAADYYSLGVIAYELMLGKRPYMGTSRKEVKEQMLAKQVQITKAEILNGWSLEAADFINKLIQRKPVQRLGLKNTEEILNHPFLKNYPIKKVMSQQMISPITTKNTQYFNSFSTTSQIVSRQQSDISTCMKPIVINQDIFQGFEYNSRENEYNQLESFFMKFSVNSQYFY